MQELGIGFGPKIRATQYKNTNIIIRAVWLGGYVKLNMAIFDQLATWKKNIVFAMGPIFNFLSAFLMMWCFWVLVCIQKGVDWYAIPVKALYGVTLTFNEMYQLTIQAIYSDGINAMVGPVGMIGLATQGSSNPFLYFLSIAVLVSISLGVINLLPIPGLDGGQILLTSAKLSKPKYIQATNIGLYCLLALGLVVTGWDVFRLLTGFWGG